MKKILALFMAVFTIGAFADVYDRTESERLYKIFREKQNEKSPETAAARDAYYKYILESEVNTENAGESCHQLVRLITIQFRNEKIAKPTRELIDARVDALWQVEYDPNDDRTRLLAELYHRARLPEAILELNNPRFDWLVWEAYFHGRRYAEALEFAIRTERWHYAFRSAVALKDNAKIFEYGRKVFLTAFVATPGQASAILTDILRPNYTGVISNEEIAAFLKEISMRYPAPNADMEAWRGFLGFVGCRYKTLTGHDLFTK